MPGSVLMHHGARADLISVNPLIDRGGAIDLIVPPKPMSKNVVGQVCSGILVEVEKADINELVKKYSRAFKRPLHRMLVHIIKRGLWGEHNIRKAFVCLLWKSP
ncbi:MAG: hypothetical protein QXH91_06310 [Candidatus Bathyarchaeia archaeon]